MSAPTARPAVAPDLLVLVALYALEAAAWVAVIASYKRPLRSLIATPSVDTAVFGGACLVLLGALVVIARRYRSGVCRGRRLAFTAALNVVPVALLLTAGEVTVRLLARSTPRGVEVVDTVLLPHRWRDLAERNRAVLARLKTEGSHLAPDPLLGWVLAPGGRSADGRYAASAEGVRSARAGERAAERPAERRVALVGDSFTFGVDVGYEDTWGRQLERALGPGVQVLNFGVEAYGVDQAYLRYRRDARPWRPDVVVLGLIDHDLYRTMAVYFFLSFPGWDYPFAKPRLDARVGGDLAVLNAPLPAPEAIAATPAIGALPFVDREPGYRADEWSDHPLDHSYLHRFLVSKYRDATRTPAPATTPMLALNREIVRDFARQVRADGARPIVVYFPSDRNFRQLARDPNWKSIGQTMLDGSGVPWVDTTPCLLPLAPHDRFPADGRNHFTPRANQAIAECLAGGVREALAAAR